MLIGRQKPLSKIGRWIEARSGTSKRPNLTKLSFSDQGFIQPPLGKRKTASEIEELLRRFERSQSTVTLPPMKQPPSKSSRSYISLDCGIPPVGTYTVSYSAVDKKVPTPKIKRSLQKNAGSVSGHSSNAPTARRSQFPANVPKALSKKKLCDLRPNSL